MRRRLRLSITLILLTSAAVAQPKPEFEVASVKLTHHGRSADGFSHSEIDIAGPGRLLAVNASMEECIQWAYQLKEYQISGPDWLKSDSASYDIEANAPANTSRAQMRLMLQSLLADRLKLKVHQETKTLPVYDLIVAKNGPKLRPEVPNGNAMFSSQGGRDGIRMTSERARVAGLASWLSNNVDRPVIDKTGITGFFSFKLQWSRGEGDGPSIYTAIQEQLGLKLQATKAPIEILVVDSAEKIPTEN